jgi:hypothetical protein
LSLSMIFVPRFSTCTSYVCLLSPLITGMALLMWSCPRFITMELDWLNLHSYSWNLWVCHKGHNLFMQCWMLLPQKGMMIKIRVG